MPNVSSTRGAAAARQPHVPSMTPPAEMTRLAQAEAAAGRGVGEMMMPKGRVDDLVSLYHAEKRDAAIATAIADNASMHILRYSYGTHKGMEAWLAEAPPRGEKLKMQVVCTPSWHVGSTEDQKVANANKYALSNAYMFEVRFPDGTKETKEFKVNGSTPEYATKSPVIEIDAEKYKGQDVVILGWPKATGVGGYTEARKTTLHL